MTVEDFADKYGISRSAIFVAINNGSVPKSVMYRPMNSKVLHVNEEWFTRRLEFRRRVYTFIQDMYYFHYSEYSDGFTAKQLGCTQTFLMYDLWSLTHSSIMRFKVPPVAWKAFRKARIPYRVIYKRNNPEFDLAKELDKMAEDVA